MRNVILLLSVLLLLFFSASANAQVQRDEVIKVYWDGSIQVFYISKGFGAKRTQVWFTIAGGCKNITRIIAIKSGQKKTLTAPCEPLAKNQDQTQLNELQRIARSHTLRPKDLRLLP